ncbi:MAG: DUF3368 domain-containing protein [Limisphaerales bacterium]
MALAKVGSLELFRRAFHEVIVPMEVFDEVAVAGADSTDGALIKEAVRNGWFRLHPAPAPAAEAWAGLDAGGTAAIRLAQTLRADAVLLDDMAARREALALGLRVMGTLGILLHAVELGTCPEAQALESLDRMQARKDIWLRRELMEAAC